MPSAGRRWPRWRRKRRRPCAKATRRSPRRSTSLATTAPTTIPPIDRAVRRGRRGVAMELPVRDPRRRRARRPDGRQHGDPQTAAGDPPDRVAARQPVLAGRRPARRPAVRRLPRRRGRPPADHPRRRRHRRAHRVVRHGAAVPRLETAAAPARRDERQERHRRHRGCRHGRGDPRRRPLGVRPRRTEVLGGEPAHPHRSGVRRRRVPASVGGRRAQCACRRQPTTRRR